MTARIDEIAPDLYRICLYVPAFDLQFNHFLVRYVLDHSAILPSIADGS